MDGSRLWLPSSDYSIQLSDGGWSESGMTPWLGSLSNGCRPKGKPSKQCMIHGFAFCHLPPTATN
ncbi:unnamed protein product [Citrullus colocynthis]|uniref:Uncharacterized protein n=1 Tax=Citrullus colocynthis TaxID=252529 RepID=A0ABP0Y7F5_9ROSI